MPKTMNYLIVVISTTFAACAHQPNSWVSPNEGVLKRAENVEAAVPGQALGEMGLHGTSANAVAREYAKPKPNPAWIRELGDEWMDDDYNRNRIYPLWWMLDAPRRLRNDSTDEHWLNYCRENAGPDNSLDAQQGAEWGRQFLMHYHNLVLSPCPGVRTPATEQPLPPDARHPF